MKKVPLRWILLFGAFLLFAGCLHSRDSVVRLPAPLPVGTVYGLENKANQGEIVGTTLYRNGSTRAGRVVAVACNGSARNLLGDASIHPGLLFLYVYCIKTALVIGFAVPSNHDPFYFPALLFIGGWRVGTFDAHPNQMALTPDGRFLYVGNGDGSLHSFQVHPNGSLSRAPSLHRRMPGRNPAILGLGILPDGKDLVVSWKNDTGAALTEYQIDPFTGTLSKSGKDILLPAPIKRFVAPTTLDNGNLLAGLEQPDGDQRAILVLVTPGEEAGRGTLKVRRFEESRGRFGTIVFGMRGENLYATLGSKRCRKGKWELKRFSVGEYGESLSGEDYACIRTGGGDLLNAVWDRNDRLLIERDVFMKTRECHCAPVLAPGIVAGGEGVVYLPLLSQTEKEKEPE